MKQKIKFDKEGVCSENNKKISNKRIYIAITIFLVTILIFCIFINTKYDIKGKTVINKNSYEEVEEQEQIQKKLVEEEAEKAALDKSKNQIKVIERKVNDILGEDKEHYGIYYYDLNTGCQYSLNADKEFQAASTMKVPIAMMIADKLSKKQLKEDTLIEYTTNDDCDGAGVLQGAVSEGQKLKVIDLMKYMIEESDNVATSMLKRNVGNIGDYIADLTSIKVDNEKNFITPKQSCIILKSLYNKSCEDIYYKKIIEFMKSTSTHDRLDKYILNEIVAHKIGDYENYVNDVGVIFMKEPYILSIYTEDVMEQGRENIAQISKVIYDIKNDN